VNNDFHEGYILRIEFFKVTNAIRKEKIAMQCSCTFSGDAVYTRHGRRPAVRYDYVTYYVISDQVVRAAEE